MSPTQPSTSLNDPTGADRRRSWGAETGAKTLDEVLSLEQHQLSQGGQGSAQHSDTPRYPGSDDSEYITWARWDALLPQGAGQATYGSIYIFNFVLILMILRRRLLILGYLSGLQIWDCTNLDSITELLNVSTLEWGRVLHAEVLPSPFATTDDEFLHSRPLLGIMCVTGISCCLLSNLIVLNSAKHPNEGPDFLVYSLSAHNIVKKISIPGIVSFSANLYVVVIVRFLPFCCLTHSISLRARQIQLRSVSCHLALSRPYLSSLPAFQPFLNLNQPQRQQQPRILIPLYYHRQIQMLKALLFGPYLLCHIAFSLTLVELPPLLHLNSNKQKYLFVRRRSVYRLT
jgi:hypothetical protein